MSIIKSSVINLYNGSDGAHLFQNKVSSTHVDIQANTLPVKITGTSVNLINYGGDTITDVVSTLTTMLAQITQLQTDITNLQVNDTNITNLLADIPVAPAPETYILLAFHGSANGIISLSKTDGTLLTLTERLALVNRNFTFRNLQNTSILKFTADSVFYGALYIDTTTAMINIDIGGNIIMLPDYVEITGERPADYKLSVNNNSYITITYTDDSALSAQDKRDLISRWWTHTSYTNTARNRFPNVMGGNLYVSYGVAALALGTEIWLV